MIGMKKWMNTENWIAGVQWFFFIFAKIVVIPITVAAAFGLPDGERVALLEFPFMVAAVACLLPGFVGYGRPIVVGQSGRWWGIFVTLIAAAGARGLRREQVGGSLAIGVMLAGVIT